jgi:hypothetical protein
LLLSLPPPALPCGALLLAPPPLALLAARCGCGCRSGRPRDVPQQLGLGLVRRHAIN